MGVRVFKHVFLAVGDGQVDFDEFVTILGPKLLSSDTREGFLGSTIDSIFWQVWFLFINLFFFLFLFTRLLHYFNFCGLCTYILQVLFASHLLPLEVWCNNTCCDGVFGNNTHFLDYFYFSVNREQYIYIILYTIITATKPTENAYFSNGLSVLVKGAWPQFLLAPEKKVWPLGL